MYSPSVSIRSIENVAGRKLLKENWHNCDHPDKISNHKNAEILRI